MEGDQGCEGAVNMEEGISDKKSSFSFAYQDMVVKSVLIYALWLCYSLIIVGL